MHLQNFPLKFKQVLHWNSLTQVQHERYSFNSNGTKKLKLTHENESLKCRRNGCESYFSNITEYEYA